MMGTRMNYYTHNIIEVKTKIIFINSMCNTTTTIGVAKANQMILHLEKVTFFPLRMRMVVNSVALKGNKAS